MEPIYDPFQFIGKIEVFTIAIVASFITMKFLNSLYDSVYEPVIDNLVNTEDIDKYYIKMGKYYIQGDTIVKDFIKWFILIIILMLIYNLVVRYYYRKNRTSVQQ